MVIHVELGGGGRPGGGRPSWIVYAPGAFMILLGLLILLMPQLLQVLVAGLCITVGVALIAVPLRMRGGGFGSLFR